MSGVIFSTDQSTMCLQITRY